jgi:hypothetical protein
MLRWVCCLGHVMLKWRRWLYYIGGRGGGCFIWICITIEQEQPQYPIVGKSDIPTQDMTYATYM